MRKGIDAWGFPVPGYIPPPAHIPRWTSKAKHSRFLDGLRRLCNEVGNSPQTHESIAQAGDVSENYVRLIERRALRKMAERLTKAFHPTKSIPA